ncbi:PPT1 [Symbiodinium natans]|uniref:PPT1 protein n=1 Tax=Symbiodinium natans TaxID=878477 RepID=A0A812LKB0_9DINO|nr:PPT1 [Symbiodinium natans]
MTRLVIFILLWYAFNVQYNVVNRLLLQEVRAPIGIAWFQLVTFSGLACVAWQTSVLPKPTALLQKLTAFVPLGIAYACGQTATVLSLAYGNVSLTHMVKSLEPVANALLSVIVLGECLHPFRYAALAAIVTGVAMCSAGHVAVQSTTVTCAAISNVCFALRNVLAKKMGDDGRVEHESPAVVKTNQLAILTMVSALVSAPVALAEQLLDKEDALNVLRGSSGHLWTLLKASVLFVAYQVSSFCVLSCVQPITHSVLNAFKRVVVIATACIYLLEPISSTQKIGVAVATLGALAFVCPKEGIHVPFRSCIAGLLGLSVAFTCAGMLSARGAPVSIVVEEVDKQITILFGAIGRHNFGDLLMAHVAAELLRQRCALEEADLVFADLLARDLRRWGGHNVQSVMSYAEPHFRSATVNLVALGGETASCSVAGALAMLVNGNGREQMKLDELTMESPHWIKFKAEASLAYILPKSLFSKPGKFITNTIGGIPTGDTDPILQEYDFCSTRNPIGNMTWKYLAPDSVVILRSLFESRISSSAPVTSRPYVAVQLKQIGLPTDFASELALLAGELSADIIFFRAGAAFGHDSLKQLQSLARQVSAANASLNVKVFRGLNIWKICGIISKAMVVVATSLHCRIVSFAFSVPRISWRGSPKVDLFIDLWDKDVQEVSYTNGSDVRSVVALALSGSIVARFKNQTAASKIAETYRSSFLGWARLLGPVCN